MTTETGSRPRTIVVGGGVIGLSCAYHLARSGHQVTLVESARCGQGASWGNAGWIVPSLVQPFNSPGAAREAVVSMLRGSSPIALRQRPTWRLLRWGFSFVRASRPAPSREAMRRLATLAADAAACTTDLARELGFELHTSGLLAPFRSRDAMAAYQAAHAQVVALGYRGRAEVLGPAALRDREPALARGLAGGIHLLDEVSVRPAAMTAALQRGLDELGGTVLEGVEVAAVRRSGSGRWVVDTATGDLRADAVVVAAGDRTGELLRTAGVRIALQAGRGCRVTVPSALSLRQALKIAEHRVACTPFAGGEVRISGTFDLVRPGAATDPSRMQVVLDAARPYLPALESVRLADLEVWSGQRPCTPDSVPLIGPMGPPGLFAATGHGTLGMTLAATTGQAITDAVTKTLPTHDQRRQHR